MGSPVAEAISALKLSASGNPFAWTWKWNQNVCILLATLWLQQFKLN
jgi:hypothetical protein